MSFAVRQAWESDLARLLALAVECQADPNRHCSYLSHEATAISAELQEIDGTDDWTTVTWVALDDARDVIGWIAADGDSAMGRVWWYGPFVSESGASMTTPVLDALFGAARTALAAYGEHELAVDARSTLLPAFADRHGFVAQEGSIALRLEDLDLDTPSPLPARFREVAAGSACSNLTKGAIELHDRLFPGTHSPGAYLFGQVDERHDRFVAHEDDAVLGYIATEVQHDGSLYVDYLGVDESSRGQGIGRALVAIAVAARASEVSHAHLTVRASNTSARRLYASLGFVEERAIVPYRLGFTLA